MKDFYTLETKDAWHGVFCLFSLSRTKKELQTNQPPPAQHLEMQIQRRGVAGWAQSWTAAEYVSHKVSLLHIKHIVTSLYIINQSVLL